MKYGVRKPSIKKSISARTTGKVKRAVKGSIDPTYGKKGMGWVKDPKKAAYNKIYNKTTISAADGARKVLGSESNADIDTRSGQPTTNTHGVLRLIIGIIALVVGIALLTSDVGIIAPLLIVLALYLFVSGAMRLK